MATEITSSYIFTPEQLMKHSKIYAGPGAGKTYFLVENVKNIVTTNDIIKKSKSRKVLCITYTNAAVEEINRRLDRYTDYVETYTIHGFIIEHIIKPFQKDLIELMQLDFGISVNTNGKISSQVEGLGILHGIDKKEIFEYINNTDSEEDNYSKKIMGEVEIDNDAFIESVKNNSERVYKIKSSKRIKDNHKEPLKKYLWSVVRKLTHNEILYFGYRILEKNPTALYALRVKFPFIFVDEFQDTNPLQTMLIKLIGQKSTKICVVGDVAQSIYSFQGAKPSDFNEFIINKNDDMLYSINGNRRSTENIVNFCNFLRKSDTNVVQKSIRKYSGEEAKQKSECKKIHFLLGESDEIKKTINEITNDNGVVLTRRWADAFDYIQDVKEEQANLLKTIYNNYYNTPIQLRDEIIEHNNVTWVRAFRFIFNLWMSYKNGSFIDMISALKICMNINLENITSKIIFQLNHLSKFVFENVDDDSITCKIIELLNNEINKKEYSNICELLGNDIVQISVFGEQEGEKIIDAVNQLSWSTSYKLFNEVFSDKSKYMTVHQAKGLEWNKVIVAAMPSSKDKISILNMYEDPRLCDENPADEFVRMYYVACSRAREDLYIHIPSGCTKDVIEKSLNNYIASNNCNIEYEFL